MCTRGAACVSLSVCLSLCLSNLSSALSLSRLIWDFPCSRTDVRVDPAGVCSFPLLSVEYFIFPDFFFIFLSLLCDPSVWLDSVLLWSYVSVLLDVLNSFYTSNHLSNMCHSWLIEREREVKRARHGVVLFLILRFYSIVWAMAQRSRDGVGRHDCVFESLCVFVWRSALEITVCVCV